MTKLRLTLLALIAMSILLVTTQTFAADDISGTQADGAKKERLDPEDVYREEFLLWFQKFYPKQSKRLDELRKKDPKLFEEHYKLKEDKLGDIMEAEKKDHEFGKALMDDLKISERQNKTLGKIRSEKDKKKRKGYIDQLEHIVSKRFDLAVKIKQFKYKQLCQKIKRLEKRLEKRMEEVKELVKHKDEEIEARVKHLLEEEIESN